MLVTHIIPSAFSYFDDIRTFVFSVTEHLETKMVEQNVFTLQYGSTTRAQRESVQSVAPKRHFKGMCSVGGIVESIEKSDIVHLHVPFLGAAQSILQAIRVKNVPLVVSYYRSIPIDDVISLYIRYYNWLYIPKLILQAAFVTNSAKYFPQNYSKIVVSSQVSFIDLFDFFGKKEPLTYLTHPVQLHCISQLYAENFLNIYKNCLIS
jgi:hypothetical protein